MDRVTGVGPAALVRTVSYSPSQARAINMDPLRLVALGSVPGAGQSRSIAVAYPGTNTPLPQGAHQQCNSLPCCTGMGCKSLKTESSTL